MRAFKPLRYSFPIICVLNCFKAAEKDDFCSYVEQKSVPQRLKPCRDQGIYGTAKPVPFVQSCFRADGRS